MKVGQQSKVLALAIAVLTALSLAACSGGEHSVSPRVLPAKRAVATFTMHWPKGQSSNAKRRLYLSPNTNSVIIEINNDPTLTTVLNKPPSGTPPVSTVSIPAPAGSDSFTITTWDHVSGGGNQLGQITVTQNIVLGAANVISATVDGILQYAGISATPNSFLELTQDGSARPVFTLVGDTPQTFTIVPEDADKNIIVPPGDSPSLSMKSSDSNVLAVTPVAGKADTYTAAITGEPNLGEPLALRIAGNDGLGDTLSAQYSIQASAAVYVAYDGATTSAIETYDQTGKIISTAGGFAGLGNVSALAYDPDDHMLFVVDRALGSLSAFDAQGNVAPGFTPVAVDQPGAAVYVSATKNVYITQRYSLSTVKAFTVKGNPINMGSGFSGLSDPCGLAYGSTSTVNQIYVADCMAGTITPFNVDGSTGSWPVLQYSGSEGFQPLGGIAYDDADYQLYAIGNAYPNSGMYSLLRDFDLSDSSFLYATAGITSPLAVAYNAANHELYVTNDAGNAISLFQGSTSGLDQDSSVTFAAPNGLAHPTAIAIAY